MDIEVNDKTVRAMAERLRSSIGTQQVSQSKAFEALADALGYKNWDTLSGLLKSGDKLPVCLAEPVELLLPCSTTDEWGSAPPYCKVTVDNEFLEQVLKLRHLCKHNGLTEARVSWNPQWGPEDDDVLDERGEEYVNINFTELTVDKSTWFFIGRVKHADYNVESRMLDVETLIKALKSRKSGEYLVWHKGHLVYDPSGSADSFIDELKDYGEL